MADACAPGRRCRHLGLLVTLGSAGVRDRRGLPAQRGRLTLDRGTHGVGQLCLAGLTLKTPQLEAQKSPPGPPVVPTSSYCCMGVKEGEQTVTPSQVLRTPEKGCPISLAAETEVPAWASVSCSILYKKRIPGGTKIYRNSFN